MPAVVATITGLLLAPTRRTCDYTMPLGLHHLIGGDHYAPMPENPDPRRADWSAIYYHRANRDGVGFDRSPRGSNAVSQYRSPLRERWADPKTTPERCCCGSIACRGRTGWRRAARCGTRSSRTTRAAQRRPPRSSRTWQSLAGQVDAERHAAVAAKLRQQAIDAAAWRDKCVGYFRQFAQP